MSFHLARLSLQFGISSRTAGTNSSNGYYYHLLFNPTKRETFLYNEELYARRSFLAT